MRYSKGVQGIWGGEYSCIGMVLIELHGNSVGIMLLHGYSLVGLLFFLGAPCGSTSGQLLLNEALLMHHFFCQIANQVLVQIFQYSCDFILLCLVNLKIDLFKFLYFVFNFYLYRFIFVFTKNK